MRLKTIWKNYKLCKSYPALRIKGSHYAVTELDLIPIGWKDLVLTMLDEMKQNLGEAFKKYKFADLKEKYGQLSIMHQVIDDRGFENLFTEEAEDLLDKIEVKYEQISAQICGECGRSLRDGEWYICEECIHSFEKVVKK